MWIGEPAPGVPAGDFSARLTAAFTPDVSGRVDALGVGRRRRPPLPRRRARWPTPPTPRPAPGCSACSPRRSSPRSRSTPAPPTRWSPSSTPAPADGPIALAGLTVEARPPDQPDAVERAVQAAADADVAVVVVGQDDRETEGMDAAVDGSADRPGRAHPCRSRPPILGRSSSSTPRRPSRWTGPTTSPRSSRCRTSVRRPAPRSPRCCSATSTRSGRLTTTHPAPARGQPRLRQLPRPGRDRRVRRGHLRRLPPLRHPRGRTALVLRARPVVHDVRLLVARRRGGRGRRRRRRGRGVGRRHEHRRPHRQRSRPGVRAAASTPRFPCRTASSRRSRR